MRRIPLNTGNHRPTAPKAYALVDTDDFKELSKYSWSFRPLKKRIGYAYRNSGSTDGMILMHRQIMQAAPDEVVKHLDKNGLNNQRANLVRSGATARA